MMIEEGDCWRELMNLLLDHHQLGYQNLEWLFKLNLCHKQQKEEVEEEGRRLFEPHFGFIRNLVFRLRFASLAFDTCCEYDWTLWL